MGLGFKYHVVTIAAIFFALTVGLVVGSLYVSPRIPKQLTNATEALRRSQAALEKTDSEIKQERDTLQTCLKSAMPYALSGRLTGKSIALIQTGSDGNGITELRDTLRQAGAQVVSVTTLEHPFEQPDELLTTRLATLHAANTNIPTDRAGLMASVAAIFAAGEQEAPSVMQTLQANDLARSDADSNYSQPVRFVVLLTGSRSETSGIAANVDVPLIDALQKAGVTVYACETQDVVTSSFPAYHAAGQEVTTVEKVDTDPGRWLLVSALAGEK